MLRKKTAEPQFSTILVECLNTHAAYMSRSYTNEYDCTIVDKKCLNFHKILMQKSFSAEKRTVFTSQQKINK